MFLRVIYHLYEEVGKGSTAEFGILAAVQVAVINRLLVGRVAKAAPWRCIAAHGSGSIGNAVVVMVVDVGELLCGGSRIGPCAVCAFQERALLQEHCYKGTRASSEIQRNPRGQRQANTLDSMHVHMVSVEGSHRLNEAIDTRVLFEPRAKPKLGEAFKAFIVHVHDVEMMPIQKRLAAVLVVARALQCYCSVMRRSCRLPKF